MLATFCARVALGLIASLLLLNPRQMHPRFFRTHFLTALGLLAVAAFSTWPEPGAWPRGLLVTTVLCFLGSLSWILDAAPLGWFFVVVTAAMVAAALGGIMQPFMMALNDYSSSALIGAALTAMLVGHSYLISPGMSLQPLMRCFLAGGIALFVRIAIVGWSTYRWTQLTPTYTLDNEVVLWLPVRWLVGIIAPLVFGWMAYSAARIRSTQSATGILYVVVVCAFLGELLGLLLTRQTGLPL
jgi:hypothetical protein